MRQARMVLGAVLFVALVIVGLSIWQHTPELVLRCAASKPLVFAWSVRCVAVGAVAAGQVILLAAVVDGIYRRDMFSGALKLSGLAVFLVAGAAALGFGLAGR